MRSHAGPFREEKRNNVITVKEVAEYLRIPRSSVYKLAQENRIPCKKVGRHWRFRRQVIENWLEADTGQDSGGQ